MAADPLSPGRHSRNDGNPLVEAKISLSSRSTKQYGVPVVLVVVSTTYSTLYPVPCIGNQARYKDGDVSVRNGAPRDGERWHSIRGKEKTCFCSLTVPRWTWTRYIQLRPCTLCTRPERLIRGYQGPSVVTIYLVRSPECRVSSQASGCPWPGRRGSSGTFCSLACSERHPFASPGRPCTPPCFILHGSLFMDTTNLTYLAI